MASAPNKRMEEIMSTITLILAAIWVCLLVTQAVLLKTDVELETLNWHKSVIKIGLVLFILANIMDVISTITFLELELGTEGNPTMDFILQKFGYAGFALIKMSAVAMIAWNLYRAYVLDKVGYELILLTRIEMFMHRLAARGNIAWLKTVADKIEKTVFGAAQIKLSWVYKIGITAMCAGLFIWVTLHNLNAMEAMASYKLDMVSLSIIGGR